MKPNVVTYGGCVVVPEIFLCAINRLLSAVPFSLCTKASERAANEIWLGLRVSVGKTTVTCALVARAVKPHRRATGLDTRIGGLIVESYCYANLQIQVRNLCRALCIAFSERTNADLLGSGFKLNQKTPIRPVRSILLIVVRLL